MNVSIPEILLVQLHWFSCVFALSICICKDFPRSICCGYICEATLLQLLEFQTHDLRRFWRTTAADRALKISEFKRIFTCLFFFPLCTWCVCEFARVHFVGIELMDTRHFWCWVWTRDFPVRCFLELKLQESVTLSDYISRSPVVYIKITSFHLFYFSDYIREVNNFPLL